nr:uncharacterized protein LOC109975355 [Labrus bergylta]
MLSPLSGYYHRFPWICCCTILTTDTTMKIKIPVLFNAVLFVVTLPFAEGETKDVTVKSGDTLKLMTDPSLKLQGDSLILWYIQLIGQKEGKTIANYESGTLKLPHPEWSKEKLQLDETLGSITIGPLSVNDSNIFHGEIIDINSTVHRFHYNVTVVDDPNPVTEKLPESRSDPNNQRSHIVVAVPTGFALLIVVVLMVKMKKQKIKKGNTQEVLDIPLQDIQP